jgi:hypothetical protein
LCRTPRIAEYVIVRPDGFEFSLWRKQRRAKIRFSYAARTDSAVEVGGGRDEADGTDSDGRAGAPSPRTCS